MDTRQLIARIAEALNWDFEEKLNLAEGPKDCLRRRGDMSYFNPSPQEILAATLSIQAGWTERERMVRAARSCGPRRWRVPQVRLLGMSEPDE